jgi:very-short-patch-repair endonuclease
LRRDASPPERVLWSRLRAGRFFGVKFKRQHPIGPYVVDFYCSGAALVIEVDGRVHEDRGEQDAARNAWMRERRLRVMRIPAVEVSRNLDNVLE